MIIYGNPIFQISLVSVGISLAISWHSHSLSVEDIIACQVGCLSAFIPCRWVYLSAFIPCQWELSLPARWDVLALSFLVGGYILLSFSTFIPCQWGLSLL